MRALHQPPVIAQRLFELCVPLEMAESLLGDLLEEFDQRASEDHAAAKRWFWGQLARSACALALQRLSQPLLTFTAGATAAFLASLIVGSIVEITFRTNDEPTISLVAGVAGLCALASAMSAAFAAHQVDISCGKAVLTALGLFVLTPDLLYAALRSPTVFSAALWLPLSLATATTLAGLHLGRRVVRNPAHP